MSRQSISCAWCGRRSWPPTGRCLTMAGNGRTVCSGCGRFQIYCTCPEAPGYYRGVSAGGDDGTAKVPDNGGVQSPTIEDPTVSLAHPGRAS